MKSKKTTNRKENAAKKNVKPNENLKKESFLSWNYSSRIISVVFFVLLLVNVILLFIFLKTGASGYLVTLFIYLFLLFGTLLIPNKFKVVKYNVLILVVLLFSVETYLKVSKKGYLDYIEYNTPGVFSRYLSKFYEYSGIRDGVYWLHSPNSSYTEVKTEFTQVYQSNEIGLRERSLEEFKNNLFNILVLGDSFVEGVGCSQEQTTPAIIESELATINNKKSIKVLNGGVAGSDLFYCYKLMEKLNKEINPKIVILSLNSSDINDIASRGGDERFQSNKVKYKNNAPWWEYIYSFSFITRVILNNYFHTNPIIYAEAKDREINYLKIMYDKIIEYKKYCDASGIQFVLVITPVLRELFSEYYYFDNLVMEIKKNTDIHVVNLREEFLQYSYINNQNYPEYYYLNDYHFKPKGYALVGRIITKEIQPYCQ